MEEIDAKKMTLEVMISSATKGIETVTAGKVTTCQKKSRSGAENRDLLL